MELSEFIQKEIMNYIDDLVRNKERNEALKRTEEYGMFSVQKDYELEIKRDMDKGDLVAVKKLYNELLKKFEARLEREIGIRLLTILNKVTEQIKKKVREYNQEVLFKDEFEKYNRIIKRTDIMPREIKGESTNTKFFDDKAFREKMPRRERSREIIEAYIVNPPLPNPETQRPVEIPIPLPPQEQNAAKQTGQKQKIQEQPKLRSPPPSSSYPQYAQAQQIRRYINYENVDPNDPYVQSLLKQIKSKELMINKALIVQNIQVATNLYEEMKTIFENFPSELYDLKIEIYSDLLSANYRIHQLANHMNRLKKIEEENKRFETKHQEIILAQEQKLELEKEKVQAEIASLKGNINVKSYTAKPKEEQLNRIESEITRLKNMARIDRLEHDKSKLFTNNQIKTNQPVVAEIRNKPIIQKEAIQKAEKQKSQTIQRNKQLIRKLYSDGIKKFLDNDNEKAKGYFKRILEINPHYKPAIIRLEQINAQT